MNGIKKALNKHKKWLLIICGLLLLICVYGTFLGTGFQQLLSTYVGFLLSWVLLAVLFHRFVPNRILKYTLLVLCFLCSSLHEVKLTQVLRIHV